jgi:hypothetical protein
VLALSVGQARFGARDIQPRRHPGVVLIVGEFEQGSRKFDVRLGGCHRALTAQGR